MQFKGLNYIFNIPEEWRDEAGVKILPRKLDNYLADEDALNIKTEEIQIPKIQERFKIHDCDGFEKPRMISILKAIMNNIPLPPIEVYAEDSGFELAHGYHRLHASIAYGFKKIPVKIIPRIDFSKL